MPLQSAHSKYLIIPNNVNTQEKTDNYVHFIRWEGLPMVLQTYEINIKVKCWEMKEDL